MLERNYTAAWESRKLSKSGNGWGARQRTLKAAVACNIEIELLLKCTHAAMLCSVREKLCEWNAKKDALSWLFSGDVRVWNVSGKTNSNVICHKSYRYHYRVQIFKEFKAIFLRFFFNLRWLKAAPKLCMRGHALYFYHYMQRYRLYNAMHHELYK